MAPQSLVRGIVLVAGAVLMLQPVYGQAKGGSTGSGGTVGTGTGTGTGTTTGTGIGTKGTGTVTTLPGNNPTNPQPNVAPPPIFLTGRVMLENGSPPPFSVPIERYCNGATHTEGYTDAKGYFGIEFGNETGVFQDASDAFTTQVPGPGGPQSSLGGSAGGSGGGSSGFNTQQRQLQNCEIRAKVTGYRSQSIILAGRRTMDDPNLGTILLHPLAADEGGSTVSASSLNAPKDAKKAFEHGLQLVKKNKPEDAMKDFQKAVDLYPAYAMAWCELGRNHGLRGELTDARTSFDAAIKADPKYVPSYIQLSVLNLKEHKWQDLADSTDRALKLDRFDYPQAFLYNAVAYYNLKSWDVAEKSLRDAERLDTRHEFPQVQHLLGVILAQRKDYPAASGYLKAYLQLAPDASDATAVRTQLADLEKLKSATASAEAPVKQ